MPPLGWPARMATIQTMKPPVKTHTSHKSCSRPSRRDFYYNHLPEKKRTELTKVNNCIVSRCEPTHCKLRILLTVKPACQLVNKISTLFTYYTSCGFPIATFNILPYYSIIAFNNCGKL